MRVSKRDGRAVERGLDQRVALVAQLEQENGASSASSRKKILSPSHIGSAGTAALSTQLSTPSLHSRSVPVKPPAVKRYMYSPSHVSDKNVTTPRQRQSVSVRPVSSYASRRRHSSGVSLPSNFPPMPTHLS